MWNGYYLKSAGLFILFNSQTHAHGYDDVRGFEFEFKYWAGKNGTRALILLTAKLLKCTVAEFLDYFSEISLKFLASQ